MLTWLSNCPISPPCVRRPPLAAIGFPATMRSCWSEWSAVVNVLSAARGFLPVEHSAPPKKDMSDCVYWDSFY